MTATSDLPEDLRARISLTAFRNLETEIGQMPQGDQYFLGHSSKEQHRLQQQAQELAADSIWLFDHVGLSPGSRVVEIGCGPQGCLEILFDRVGQGGSVVGVEMSEEAVALARAFVSHRQMRNVEVWQGDAQATGLPRNTYDLATARLVLVNVPKPEAIVAEMAALVRPGASLLCTKRIGGWFCVIPRCPHGTP